MPPIELSVGELLRVMKKLKDGVEISKCKVDGKKVQLESGTMKGDIDDLDVHIDLAYKNGEQTIKVEGKHPRSDKGNVIQIDEATMADADIDLRLVFVMFRVELKATLEYTHEAGPHKMEVYAKIGGV